MEVKNSLLLSASTVVLNALWLFWSFSATLVGFTVQICSVDSEEKFMLGEVLGNLVFLKCH